MNSSPLQQYLEYVNNLCDGYRLTDISQLDSIAEDTNWDEPENAIDLNNIAVMALIKSQTSGDTNLRSLHLDMALEALEAGAQQGNPLCVAHMAVVRSLIGETQSAINIAFPTFLQVLQLAVYPPGDSPKGLIYLPDNLESGEQIPVILAAANGYEQSVLLLSTVLLSGQLVFYNTGGLRFLYLAAHLFPNSFELNLSLGIASLVNQQWEGLMYLIRAHQLIPEDSTPIQALYLAYKQLGQENYASFWHSLGAQKPLGIDWRWRELPLNNSFTYLPFEDFSLAVEASFNSLVTGVLLARGDWFEAEMELWRAQLQEGMTVIDVGANVGVYTFSAAKKVGKSGKVIAIEPFSGCVECLEETCRVNDLSMVKIYATAASDSATTAFLAINSASELNEVIQEAAEGVIAQEITTIPLDSLILKEHLTRVDWLKIDAEGHELQVLTGSQLLIEQFQPNIIYENIAGDQGSNTIVAEYLMNNGYQLFRYQPYLQQLIPLESIEELALNLNIIALPTG